jgi:DNA-binding CsgD family transcriptional regulator
MGTDSVPVTDSDRLLATLEGLLSIRSLELRGALDEAAMPVLNALGADKLDVFLYQPESDSLVAMGASDTPLAHRQRQLGLDRLAIANGGRVVETYRTGVSAVHGHVDEDVEELKGVKDGLGIRSQLNVPLHVNGELRGVLSAVSSHVERFTEQDLLFVKAIAGWIGIVTGRAELAEAMTQRAFERGRRTAADELTRLTSRQREIAALIAEGLTNEEIAERLVVVTGTVANHIASMLSRLGLRNRTQIATWAVERGLFQSGALPFETSTPSVDGIAKLD